jgi:hypothetical protein
MPDDLIPKENTGVIEGSATKDLWLAGRIPYEVRNQSGDWRPFLVKEEKQYSANVDTMGCVSFSCNNALEIQTKFLTGQEVNYSDRFLAKMSGTTHDGNYCDKVADTARNIGLVKEEEWPTVGNYNWDQYYSPIPQEVINKAVKLGIQYEGVYPLDAATLSYHLKQAPLQITIPAPHPNHAVVLVHISGNTAYYFDTYSPYLKTISVSAISYAMKIVINPKKNMQLIRDKGTIYLVAGVNKKVKTGIASAEVLTMLFGDEPIVDGDTSSIPQSQTASTGLVIHKV